MEKLSKKCQAICVCALGCLVTAIALAPAGPSIPRLPGGEQPGREIAAAGVPGYQPLQNCTGGYSVNCHSTGNQAGL